MDRPGLGHDTAEPACDMAWEGLQYARDMGCDTAGRAHGRAAARARGLASVGRDIKIVSWLRRGDLVSRYSAAWAAIRHSAPCDTKQGHCDTRGSARHALQRTTCATARDTARAWPWCWVCSNIMCDKVG